MKEKNGFSFVYFILTVSLILGGVFLYNILRNDNKAGNTTFNYIGLSLDVPKDLKVIKVPEFNREDGKTLQGYNFYIEDYDEKGLIDFQIYGIYQFNYQKTWEDISQEVKNTETYSYAKEINFNGLRGYETQISGQRSRFCYLFSVDNRALKIYVSPTTPESKNRAESILKTIDVNEDAITNQSSMRNVEDPNGYYSRVLIPDGWSYNFSSNNDSVLSELFVKSGHEEEISFTLIVIADTSASLAPDISNIESKEELYIGGINIDEYVYKNPEDNQFKIRERRFIYDSKSYIWKFTYSSDADMDIINAIVENLILVNPV